MIAKLLIPLLVAGVLFVPAASEALAQKSLLVPEAYPKVEPFNPKWKKPASALRFTWWRRHFWK